MAIIVYLATGVAFAGLTYLASTDTYTETTIEKTDATGQGYDKCVALGSASNYPYAYTLETIQSSTATTVSSVINNNFGECTADACSHFRDACMPSTVVDSNDYTTGECGNRNCFVLGLVGNPSAAVPWDSTDECISDLTSYKCADAATTTFSLNDDIQSFDSNNVISPSSSCSRKPSGCTNCLQPAAIATNADGKTYQPSYLANSLTADVPGTVH